MERWENYYHNCWGAYPAVYTGASHVRYPVPQLAADAGCQHWGEYDVFNGQHLNMEHRPGLQSHGQQFDPAEEELVTFNRESPSVSLEDDDPQV